MPRPSRRPASRSTRMPGTSGLALFDGPLERGIASAWLVIFLTGHASVATAVEAGRRLRLLRQPFSPTTRCRSRATSALAVSRQRAWRTKAAAQLRAPADD